MYDGEQKNSIAMTTFIPVGQLILNGKGKDFIKVFYINIAAKKFLAENTHLYKVI